MAAYTLLWQSLQITSLSEHIFIPLTNQSFAMVLLTGTQSPSQNDGATEPKNSILIIL